MYICILMAALLCISSVEPHGLHCESWEQLDTKISTLKIPYSCRQRDGLLRELDFQRDTRCKEARHLQIRSCIYCNVQRDFQVKENVFRGRNQDIFHLGFKPLCSYEVFTAPVPLPSHSCVPIARIFLPMHPDTWIHTGTLSRGG